METREFAESRTNDLQEKDRLILSLREEIAYLKKKTAGLRQEVEYYKEILTKNGLEYGQDLGVKTNEMR